jgi:hypothetical protein
VSSTTANVDRVSGTHAARPRALAAFPRIARLIVAVVAALAPACGADPHADLRQSAEAMLWTAAPRQLRRSQFTALFPQGTPSQLVSYLFSTIGTAEWPESASRVAQDPELREMTRLMHMPLLADGIRVTHTSPKLELGRQIVVRADDAKQRIIVEGYADPTEPPVVTLARELRVPELARHEREYLEALARSNLDSGATAQAF